MAISPEVEAELRRLCAEEASGDAWLTATSSPKSRWAIGLHHTGFTEAARNHLPALLDQIAADRPLIEEAAKGLANADVRITNSLENSAWRPSRAHMEGARNDIRRARETLAKQRAEYRAGPSPDTLRPGENDSLDTHQDKPFGAGGQESGR